MNASKCAAFLLGGSAALATLIAPRSASSYASLALVGVPEFPADKACWVSTNDGNINGGGFVNNCGSGGNATKKLMMPATAGWWGTTNFAVRASGTSSQNLQWVRCRALNYTGVGVNATSGVATIGGPAFYQDIQLGSMYVGNSGGIEFDCDATWGGIVHAVYWW